MSAEALTLGLFCQRSFSGPVSRTLVASSPSLNLTATVDGDDKTLTISRAKGEIVSSNTDGSHKIQALCWRADGRFLAVARDDGTVRLWGVEHSKLVHRISVTRDGDAADVELHPEPITYIAWARNLTGKRHFDGHHDMASRLQGLGLALSKEPTWEDETSGTLDNDVSDVSDLPHALAFLEIDNSLPKLSPLPVSGGIGDDMFVFSTTTSLDSMFPPLRPQGNDVVDIMAVGTGDGCVHLSIYDSFPIGSFRIPIRRGASPSSSQMDGNYQLDLHTSHPKVSTHSLLLRQAGEGPMDHLYLIPMDLRFVSHSPVNLSLLAYKTTTLHKLLRYLKQTQIHMVNEWTSTREMPTRLLSPVQEDLEKRESGPTNMVQALYHCLLTGHFPRPVKEWLVDSIAERGLKRWEKAVIPGLENLRNLVHQNMLPAIERCTVILSRLSGLARFHEQDDDVGFTNLEISRLVDVMSALHLACHRVLLIVMEELELFRTFSGWLRQTIIRLSSAAMTEESTEKEGPLDPSKVLGYIGKYLVSSPMAVHFGKVSQEAWDEDWARMQASSAVLDELDTQIKRQEAGEPYMEGLLQMGFLVDLLTAKASDTFQSIAEAEKRSVRFGQAVRLELPRGTSGFMTFAAVDAKMCSLPKPNGVDGITYTAVVSEERPLEIAIFQSRIEIINGVSSAPRTSLYYYPCLGADSNSRIIEIRFLDEEVLLALCLHQDGTPTLFRIPFRRVNPGDEEDRRDTGSLGITALSRVPTSPAQVLDFPRGDTAAPFVPARMEVLEANGTRGGVPARVCLLGIDGVSYRVYSLPDQGHLLQS